MVRRDVVGSVLYSTQDSDSSSLRRQGIILLLFLSPLFPKFSTFLSQSYYSLFSETRDQLSARVLSATDDETQSLTVNPIQQVTDAAPEIDNKPSDVHVSADTSQSKVRFTSLARVCCN